MQIDRLPMPAVNGVYRRIVRDNVNGVLIDDLWNSSRAKPERVSRSMRHRRDVTVEIEVNEVNTESTKPWEE